MHTAFDARKQNKLIKSTFKLLFLGGGGGMVEIFLFCFLCGGGGRMSIVLESQSRHLHAVGHKSPCTRHVHPFFTCLNTAQYFSPPILATFLPSSVTAFIACTAGSRSCSVQCTESITCTPTRTSRGVESSRRDADRLCRGFFYFFFQHGC